VDKDRTLSSNADIVANLRDLEREPRGLESICRMFAIVPQPETSFANQYGSIINGHDSVIARLKVTSPGRTSLQPCPLIQRTRLSYLCTLYIVYKVKLVHYEKNGQSTDVFTTLSTKIQ
jgi:hypothetical protein